MGKTKKGRQRDRKSPPTGLPSVETTLKANSDAAPITGIPNSVNICLRQLQSHEALDKECGLLTLTELAGQADAPPLFASLRLTRHVAPLLVDPEDSVRLAAAGTLRAMAVEAVDSDAIDAMVQDDVMTPVSAATAKHFPPCWNPGKIISHASKDFQLFFDLVQLLRSLCASSLNAQKIFNENHLINSLLPALDVKLLPYPIITAVCECLLTVTENNQPVIDCLKSNKIALEHLQKLLHLHSSGTPNESKEAKFLLLSILAAGICLNLCGENIGSASQDVLTPVLDLVQTAIKIDVPAMIKKLKEILTSKVSMETEETEMETSVNNNSTKSKTLGVNTAVCNLKELEQIKDILGAQQIALEIFTNICSFADDELDELDDNSSSSSESIADSFMNSDDHPISKESLTLPSKICNSILSSTTIETLTSHCGTSLREAKLTLEAIADELESPHAVSILKKLSVVQCRALTTIHNLLSYEAADFGGIERISGLFIDLFATLPTLMQGTEDELVETTTSAMRGIATRLNDKNPEFLGDLLPSSNIDILHSLFGRTSKLSQSIKVNIIQIISNLARNTQVESLTSMGSFLLLAANDADLAVSAEALDALFDVYGQDVDIVYEAERRIALIDHLNSLFPTFKDKVQHQKKLTPEQKLVVQTVRNNFQRFIQYKMSKS